MKPNQMIQTIYPEYSDDDDQEKQPVVKKVSKSLGHVETVPWNSGYLDTEVTLRAMIFPISP